MCMPSMPHATWLPRGPVLLSFRRWRTVDLYKIAQLCCFLPETFVCAIDAGGAGHGGYQSIDLEACNFGVGNSKYSQFRLYGRPTFLLLFLQATEPVTDAGTKNR